MTDKETHRILFGWAIFGAFFLMSVGSLLHFTYEWSGYSPLVAMVSAATESVWEHLKLGFWCLVLYSSFEYWYVKDKANNYFAAKALGILSMQLFIVAFFYSYTALTHSEILVVDIASYFVGAVLCQFISFKIMTGNRLKNWASFAGTVFLLFHALILSVFTFAPPHLPIFKDSNTQQYGTTWEAPARPRH